MRQAIERLHGLFGWRSESKLGVCIYIYNIYICSGICIYIYVYICINSVQGADRIHRKSQDRGKSISQRLIFKFNKVRQTTDDCKYELKERKCI